MDEGRIGCSLQDHVGLSGLVGQEIEPVNRAERVTPGQGITVVEAPLDRTKQVGRCGIVTDRRPHREVGIVHIEREEAQVLEHEIVGRDVNVNVTGRTPCSVRIPDTQPDLPLEGIGERTNGRSGAS